ncbi:bifunctional lysylphosphatidylglycerol flippase/synthetase MprF [Novosphingobium taihuense]|uniref:Phosphatidylglycerol lysyltransferase n=2 Tax=Novosphingobium taihuense TaxID=260085 RepID=A0A7W7A830_9SPHN|nr:bifunctional lysylphosphatidylglycerol flippase/synthetase MprF [Novosphingobium taihuense]MBB4611932.1 phosphatidylglycerol lysyltransferase [Novosphingobium taihuense]
MSLALSHAPRIPRKLLIGIAFLCIAVIVLLAIQRIAGDLDPHRIAASIRALPPWRILCAIGLTAVSHLLLTFYDVIALRCIGSAIAPRTAARAAFTSYTLSHNLGFSPLTGGSARMRIYGRAGLTPSDVARIIVLAGMAFWAGVVAVAGISLALAPAGVAIAGFALPSGQTHLLGAMLVIAVVAIPALVRIIPVARNATNRFLPVPDLPTSLALVAVAAVDLAVAALALFVLVPGMPLSAFPQIYLSYALAIIAGLLTHVPGGLGVFEAVFLAALPTGSPAAPYALAALVAYRAIYYLLPLACSLLMNTTIEARGLQRLISPFLRPAKAIADAISPFAFAVLTFGGGSVLLLSGALPGVDDRMHRLHQFLPLPFIDVSHLAASLVGTLLVLVAPALASRLESGLKVARALFLLGACFSLAKGLDYEEASVMLVLAGLLQLASPAFYRKTAGAFTSQSRGWLVAALAAVCLAASSGIVAYRQLPYDTELWWQFVLHGDASSFLRASFGTGILATAIAIRSLLGSSRRLGGLSSLPDAIYRNATGHSSRSDSALAYTGDKRFLINPSGDAFVMFRPCGNSWIVMGDPVGPFQRWRDLVWDLRMQSDRCNARLCFYQVSDRMLPLIVDLGLKPMKYGEEAIIDLQGFTLSGPKLKNVRNAHARAQREGLRLQIVPPSEVPQWFDRVNALSDVWLRLRGTKEKSFSLGHCALDYLARSELALVFAQDGDSLMAFANIWKSGDGREYSVDLMRHAPDAPPGTMDFLLVELCRVARQQEFERFNLGMAPLSGLSGGKLAPLWARLANMAFASEGLRYNFGGLRRFKEKFAPRWENRFIAIAEGNGGRVSLLNLLATIGL